MPVIVRSVTARLTRISNHALRSWAAVISMAVAGAIGGSLHSDSRALRE